MTVIEVEPGVIGIIIVDPGYGASTQTEIDKTVLSIMEVTIEASGPVSGGGEALPEGVVADTSAFDFEAGGGTTTLDGYEADVDYVMTEFVTFMEQMTGA
jgi:hypothetical protein